MPAWIWFVVALVAAAGGALLLWYDRGSTERAVHERRDWAASKGWDFTDAMSAPPHAWRYGTLRGDGPRQVYDVATGAVPGPGGRRLGCIFDQEADGEPGATIAAVRGTVAVPVALELRRPESPRPDDDELDNLGQVGRRYAFVSNAHEGRRLLSREVIDAADRVGEDVPLVWAEDTWVLASIEPGADPERVEGLIESLVEVSAAIKDAVEGGGTDLDGPGSDDARDAPTSVVGGRVDRPADDDRRPGDDRDRRRDDGRPEAERRPADPRGPEDLDDDLEYDEELERFASGDEDESPYSGGARGRGPTGPASRGAAEPTHRDRPGEIPYDLERDDPGSDDTERREPRSSQGSTWRSGPFRGR